jgi:tight adherence protein C
MTLDWIITLSAAFMFIALVSGWATSAILSARSPERRRLQHLAGAGGGAGGELSLSGVTLIDTVDPRFRRIPGILPTSPKEMNRLRRRLALAGYHSPTSMVVYGVATLATPIVFGLVTLSLVGMRYWFFAGLAAAIGWMLPGIVLAHQISKRKLQIQNGLPDALDLLIVCVEAGCALDQAIVKASEELAIAYPVLSAELRMINTEMRAGKPRLEAFKNFGARTKVEDVLSLVALLVQTDKFGTSIAQALRTHAETSRTKRRQRAEERAAKIGVKLVFPLVFFLFPALYAVILGPAVISFIRVFHGNVLK